jgi:filamentous hemagglutinin
MDVAMTFGTAGIGTAVKGVAGLTKAGAAAVAAGTATKAAKTPLWTSTGSKSAVENAYGHWKKHGAEFPEYQNSKQYVEGAKSFFNSPPAGTLTKSRANGDQLFYNPTNNTFGVQTTQGAPRTMFRPADGINYWNKQ